MDSDPSLTRGRIRLQKGKILGRRDLLELQFSFLYLIISFQGFTGGIVTLEWHQKILQYSDLTGPAHTVKGYYNLGTKFGLKDEWRFSPPHLFCWKDVFTLQQFHLKVVLWEMNQPLNLSFKPRVEIIKLLFMKLHKNVSIQLLSDSHKETSQWRPFSMCFN